MHEAALFGKTDVVQILLAAGERLAALLSTQHSRVGIVPLASPEGYFCWLHLNPVYVYFHWLIASIWIILK